MESAQVAESLSENRLAAVRRLLAPRRARAGVLPVLAAAALFMASALFLAFASLTAPTANDFTPVVAEE